MKYMFDVNEYRMTTIMVEADSPEAARDKIVDGWSNGKITFDNIAPDLKVHQNDDVILDDYVKEEKA